MPKEGFRRWQKTRKAPPSVKKGVAEALSGRKHLSHLSELAEHFIDIAGGERAFAKMLYDEWVTAPEGGLVRTRIFDLVSRAWKSAPSDAIGDNLGVLSEEDLQRVLANVIETVEETQEQADAIPSVPKPPQSAPDESTEGPTEGEVIEGDEARFTEA